MSKTVKYDFDAIEKKWQKRWADAEVFKVEETIVLIFVKLIFFIRKWL